MLVYIANGSEDGLLGVYSSVEKAYNRAVSYVREGFGFNEATAVIPTLQEAKRTLRIGSGKYSVDFEGDRGQCLSEIRVVEVE